MSGIKNGGLVPRRLEIRREAKERISSDRLSFLALIFCVFSVLAQASLILVSWRKLPPQIPFFYSRPWGEAMLGNPILLWILPASVVGILVINFFVGIFLVRGNIFINRILISVGLLIAFITLYDTVKIISLLT